MKDTLKPDWDPRSETVIRDQRAAYDAMRKRCPVAFSDYLQWSLFRHEDIVRVLNDPAAFSNARISLSSSIAAATGFIALMLIATAIFFLSGPMSHWLDMARETQSLEATVIRLTAMPRLRSASGHPA